MIDKDELRNKIVELEKEKGEKFAKTCAVASIFATICLAEDPDDDELSDEAKNLLEEAGAVVGKEVMLDALEVGRLYLEEEMSIKEATEIILTNKGKH